MLHTTGRLLGPAPPCASAHVEDLLGRVEVERVDDLRYRGTIPEGGPRVFGGPIVAQCLAAAQCTMRPERHACMVANFFDIALMGAAIAPGASIDFARGTSLDHAV